MVARAAKNSNNYDSSTNLFFSAKSPSLILNMKCLKMCSIYSKCLYIKHNCMEDHMPGMGTIAMKKKDNSHLQKA